MKTIISALIFCIFVVSTYAETAIFPLGEGGRIDLATNEVLVLSSHLKNVSESQAYPIIIKEGVTNDFTPIDLGRSDAASATLTGPASLIFPTNAVHMINYRKLTNSSIMGLVLRAGFTNVVSVPDGKTLRMYSKSPLSADYAANGFYRFGTNTILLGLGTNLFPPQEFSGPGELGLGLPSSNGTEVILIGYYFTDAAFTFPGLGVLQGPTGGFTLTIEKSIDLTNWAGVVTYPTTADQKAFYRFKIGR